MHHSSLFMTLVVAAQTIGCGPKGLTPRSGLEAVESILALRCFLEVRLDLPANAVAWWRLDDGWGLTALDSLGVNHGTLNEMDGSECSMTALEAYQLARVIQACAEAAE